jgi:hypothetical protein
MANIRNFFLSCNSKTPPNEDFADFETDFADFESRREK